MGRRRHHPARRHPPRPTTPSTVSAPQRRNVSRICPLDCASRPASTTVITSAAGWNWWTRARSCPSRNGANRALPSANWRATRSAPWNPRLSPALPRAYHLPDMAQVRNPRHLRAVATRLREARRSPTSTPGRPGVRPRGRPHRRRADRSRRTGRPTIPRDGRRLDRRPACNRSACRLGVRPVRGQIALLQTDDPRPRPVLLQGTRYLVTRTDGRVLVGSDEEDAGFDARPTAGGDRRSAGLRRRTGPVAGGRGPGTLLGGTAARQPRRPALPRPRAGLRESVRGGRPLPRRHPALAGHGSRHDRSAPRPAARRAARRLPPRPAARPAGPDGIPILRRFG